MCFVSGFSIVRAEICGTYMRCCRDAVYDRFASEISQATSHPLSVQDNAHLSDREKENLNTIPPNVSGFMLGTQMTHHRLNNQT